MCVELVQDPMSHHISVMSAPCVWHLFRIPCHTIYLSCQLYVCGTCSGIHTNLCHSVFIFSGFSPIELLCLWLFYGAVACSHYTDSIIAVYRNVQSVQPSKPVCCGFDLCPQFINSVDGVCQCIMWSSCSLIGICWLSQFTLLFRGVYRACSGSHLGSLVRTPPSHPTPETVQLYIKRSIYSCI